MRTDLYANFIFHVGEFHTVLCALHALGSYIENCGIDDPWVQCDLYATATTRQILEGKHMKGNVCIPKIQLLHAFSSVGIGHAIELSMLFGP